MQRDAHHKNQPGRKPARWTFLEIGMLVIALLLIVFPLYAEAYRWVNPLLAPAAPRLQRVTDTPLPDTPTGTILSSPTNTQVATDTPTATSGTGATDTPTATSGTGATDTPTATSGTGATDTPTATSGTGATDTPTATGAPSPTPTNTPVPGTPTPTLTPIPNDAPLRLFKSSSATLIQVGQQYNYTLSVFSNSTTASTVDVRDTIDSQLDVVRTSASKGTCSAANNQVSCSVTVQNNQPVTINITVQVRANATLGGRISNRALAQDNRQFTAASDTVAVDISNVAATPGGPTNTPGGPTNTPGGPTNTPGGPTNTPGGPTNTPGGPTNTPKPTATSKPSSGSGSDSNSAAVPTSPLLPPLPPTPQPGAAPRVPVSRPSPGSGLVGGSPTSSATATVAPAEAGTFFRMASDWGSAFTGQEVNYVIAFRNTRTTGAINNLVITSVLPQNLQIIEQKSDHGDPQLQGNQLTFKLASLQAGQGVEIAVRAKIKDDVEVGTRLISQAEATYDGLAMPLRSNIVTILIVGTALGPVQANVQAASPSATVASTASPVPSTPTSAMTATAAPTASPTAKPTSASAASAPQLPATSSGVPISGFALLGLTMLLRTVRLHREKSRI